MLRVPVTDTLPPRVVRPDPTLKVFAPATVTVLEKFVTPELLKIPLPSDTVPVSIVKEFVVPILTLLQKFVAPII